MLRPQVQAGDSRHEQNRAKLVRAPKQQPPTVVVYGEGTPVTYHHEWWCIWKVNPLKESDGE